VGNFTGFLVSFLVLFLTTGIGNGSTFRMIPVIFLTRSMRAWTDKTAQAVPMPPRKATPEGAATLGFQPAIGGLRRLLHPQELRQLDRADRRPRTGAVRLHRLLPGVHHRDLVVLRRKNAPC
jgi:nitrate/nitrite transporter NarK